MAKTLGLDIVIGSVVAGAISGFKSVISESNRLGSAIEKLNQKKLTILDGIDKEFKEKLAPIENKLQSFYGKQKEIKLQIKVKDNEIKELKKSLQDTDKEIKKLEKEKLNLDREFKKGKISASEFNQKTKEIEKELSKLSKKKINLDKKLELVQKKSTLLNNSLKHIQHTINNLQNKKLSLTNELEKAKEKALETNKELKRLGNAIEKINRLKLKLETAELKREEFKSKFFDTVAIGVSASFPVKKAIEFESAMADVAKVANLDETETIKMSKALEKLSTTIPIAADGLASIAASGASLGIAKDKLIDFTKIVAKMSTAFDMSADEAGEAVAKIMNVYGLGLKETSKLGDVINYLSDNTAAKARDMINVLSRIGGTAKMFGLSAKNAAALADAFLAMGKPPEVAATAINALLTKLNTADKQSKQFQEGLKALGLTAIDIKFAIKNDPQKAIMMVLNRIKQFDKQTQMSILTQMFGAEYSDDIALLVGGLDNYKKALGLVSDEQKYHNSMQKEFENRSKTTANQLQLLGNSLNRIAIDLGSVVLPVIKDFARGGAWIADKIVELNQEFPILGKVISYVGVGIGGFVVTAAALGYAFSFVSSGLVKARIALTLFTSSEIFAIAKTKLLTIAYKALHFSTKILTLSLNLLGKSLLFVGTKLKPAGIYAYNLALKTLSFSAKFTSGALKFVGNSLLWLERMLLTNPIGLAITAIAFGAYLIWKNWNKLKGFFSDLWDEIKNIFTSALNFIKKIFSFSPLGIIVSNWSVIKNYFLSFWSWLENKFNAGIAFISAVFSRPVEAISGIWSKLINWFNSFWRSLKNGFKNGVEFITGIFLSPINTIQKLWNKLLGWISSKLKWITSIGSKIKHFFGFGDDKEKKLTLKPAVEKIKPIVTSAAVGATIIAAQPQNINPQVKNQTITLKVTNPTITPKTTIPTITPNVNNPVINPSVKVPTITANVKPKISDTTITPKINPTINPQVKNPTIAPKIKPTITPTINPQVVNPKIKPKTLTQIIPTQNTPNQQIQPNIIYNFNFGDIKVETKDGKIANPQNLKEEIKRILEEVNFEKYQRSLSDVM